MATAQTANRSQGPKRRPPPPGHVGRRERSGPRFARAQGVNATRNAAALRPFRADEFGRGAASPSQAHIAAANALISQLRRSLQHRAAQVRQIAAQAAADPQSARLQAILHAREQADQWIKLVEQIWDYYLELFGQRQTRFAPLLLATDRIGLDCYQAVYTGLGVARSIPAPPPFSYMETGFTPATFRRGVALTRLGKRANPFPTIQLPYHRLINPWTLGAVHHEVAHNIQSDLGMWEEVPRQISARLRQAGLPAPLVETWARWHKEIWADLCGLLLGGPAIVASLIDVLARSPRGALAFNPLGVHPTPYLRTLINLELLTRMGFRREAHAFDRLWRQLYPDPRAGNIPPAFLQYAPQAIRLVVDTLCYQPYTQLGARSLAQVAPFKPIFQPMIAEAAQRLAAGTDPGIIPARFLVGAARYALDRQLAAPNQITRNFYRALNTR